MKHVPNILTVIRIFMIPLFLYTYLSMNDGSIAVIIFILAGVTDVVDGYIARRYNVVSQFGMLMDPLADKLMQVAAAIALISRHIVPLWLVLLMAGKEMIMVIMGIFAYRKKDIVIAAKVYGKIASFIIIASLSVLIWLGKSLLPIHVIVLHAVIAASILFSGTGYLVHYLRIKKGDVNEQKNRKSGRY